MRLNYIPKLLVLAMLVSCASESHNTQADHPLKQLSCKGPLPARELGLAFDWIQLQSDNSILLTDTTHYEFIIECFTEYHYYPDTSTKLNCTVSSELYELNEMGNYSKTTESYPVL